MSALGFDFLGSRTCGTLNLVPVLTLSPSGAHPYPSRRPNSLAGDPDRKGKVEVVGSTERHSELRGSARMPRNLRKGTKWHDEKSASKGVLGPGPVKPASKATVHQGQTSSDLFAYFRIHRSSSRKTEPYQSPHPSAGQRRHQPAGRSLDTRPKG